jgi:Bacterial extracellular solute-binding proteins, family 5 Middle
MGRPRKNLPLDERLEPQPSLAERWAVSDDGKLYTFHLAKGVQWHDAKPFAAAAVKFTFEHLLLQFHARTRAGLQPVLDAIHTPDDATVAFQMQQPYAPFLRHLDVVEERSRSSPSICTKRLTCRNPRTIISLLARGLLCSRSTPREILSPLCVTPTTSKQGSPTSTK